MSDLFEEHRSRLRAVAFRMLGSASEADDALQEAWLRVDRASTDAVENPAAWLTTVVTRVCLNMLRARGNRREEEIDAAGPVPAVDDPEREAVLVDGVGQAMLVVLDALSPAERVAFVLHDMFDVPFDQIAPVLDRTPAAVRQLASRARRRVRGGTPAPDVPRQRRVVEAFLTASRAGDFHALLDLLAPDVVLHADAAAGPTPRPLTLRGADRVARGATLATARALHAVPALVDGAVGLILAPAGRLRLALAFTVTGDGVTVIDVIADPARLAALDVAVLDP